MIRLRKDPRDRVKLGYIGKRLRKKKVKRIKILCSPPCTTDHLGSGRVDTNVVPKLTYLHHLGEGMCSRGGKRGIVVNRLQKW